VGWLAHGVRHWLSQELAAGSHNLTSSLDDVGDLKAEASPSPLPLAATVDADDRAGNLDFADHIAVPKKVGVEGDPVKLHRAAHFCRPENVFGALDIHETNNRQSPRLIEVETILCQGQIGAVAAGKLVVQSEKRCDLGMSTFVTDTFE
jgi:hypothetical protein